MKHGASPDNSRMTNVRPKFTLWPWRSLSMVVRSGARLPARRGSLCQDRSWSGEANSHLRGGRCERRRSIDRSGFGSRDDGTCSDIVAGANDRCRTIMQCEKGQRLLEPRCESVFTMGRVLAPIADSVRIELVAIAEVTVNTYPDGFPVPIETRRGDGRVRSSGA